MKIRVSSIIIGCFALLAFILFCNLNGLLYLMMGVSAPLSPIILLLSAFIIGLSFIKGNVKSVPKTLIIIIAFYLSYLFIGFINYVIDPLLRHPNTSIAELIRSYLSSIIIILAFYLGSHQILIRNGKFALIKFIFFLLLFSAIIIAFSSELRLTDYYKFASNVTLNADRQSGIFGDPNETGSFGLYFIVMTFTMFTLARKSWIPILVLIPLGYYIVFYSFSRASMIIGVFILFLYMLFNLAYLKNHLKKNLLKPAIFVSGLVLMVFLLINRFSDDLRNLTYGQKTRLFQTSQLFEGKINKNTTSYRSRLYNYAWKKIKNRPLRGYGLGSFHRIKEFNKSLGVHNTQLLIWAESGIIPISLFILFFVIIGFTGLRHPDPGIGFLMVGFVVVYFFNVAGTLHNALDDRISNAFVGIVISLVQYKQINNSSKEHEKER